MRTLRWYESSGRPQFCLLAYEQFGRNYPQEFRILTAAGISYANLGEFVFDTMRLEGSGRWENLKYTVPNGNTEWIVVLRRCAGLHKINRELDNNENHNDEPEDQLQSEDEFQDSVEDIEGNNGHRNDNDTLPVYAEVVNQNRPEINEPIPHYSE